MSVAIIMTVFNRLEKTKLCIDSLEKTLIGVEHTYYITNDGSKDGTAEYLHKISNEVNLVIHNGDGNLFWNRGMYYSYENALRNSHEWYLWVNNDTCFYQNLWDVLMEDYRTASKMNPFSAVCGSIQSGITKETTYGGTNECGLINPSGNVKQCTHINGNCLLIPKCVSESIGNLDFRYEHGLGDFDYGQRIIEAGGCLFTSHCYVGTCEKNSILGSWKDMTLPIKKRITLMKAKTGQPRKSYKIYLKKWNKRTWLFYYYKPYFDIVFDRVRYIVKNIGNKT